MTSSPRPSTSDPIIDATISALGCCSVKGLPTNTTTLRQALISCQETYVLDQDRWEELLDESMDAVASKVLGSQLSIAQAQSLSAKLLHVPMSNPIIPLQQQVTFGNLADLQNASNGVDKAQQQLGEVKRSIERASTPPLSTTSTVVNHVECHREISALKDRLSAFAEQQASTEAELQKKASDLEKAMANRNQWKKYADDAKASGQKELLAQRETFEREIKDAADQLRLSKERSERSATTAATQLSEMSANAVRDKESLNRITLEKASLSTELDAANKELTKLRGLQFQNLAATQPNDEATRMLRERITTLESQVTDWQTKFNHANSRITELLGQKDELEIRTNKEINALKDTNKALIATKNEQLARIAQKAAEIEQQGARIAAQDIEKNGLQAQKSKLEGDIKGHTAEIARLMSEIAQKAATIDEQRAIAVTRDATITDQTEQITAISNERNSLTAELPHLNTIILEKNAEIDKLKLDIRTNAQTLEAEKQSKGALQRTYNDLVSRMEAGSRDEALRTQQAQKEREDKQRAEREAEQKHEEDLLEETRKDNANKLAAENAQREADETAKRAREEAERLDKVATQKHDEEVKAAEQRNIAETEAKRLQAAAETKRVETATPIIPGPGERAPQQAPGGASIIEKDETVEEEDQEETGHLIPKTTVQHGTTDMTRIQRVNQALPFWNGMPDDPLYKKWFDAVPKPSQSTAWCQACYDEYNVIRFVDWNPKAGGAKVHHWDEDVDGISIHEIKTLHSKFAKGKAAAAEKNYSGNFVSRGQSGVDKNGNTINIEDAAFQADYRSQLSGLVQPNAQPQPTTIDDLAELSLGHSPGIPAETETVIPTNVEKFVPEDLRFGEDGTPTARWIAFVNQHLPGWNGDKDDPMYAKYLESQGKSGKQRFTGWCQACLRDFGALRFSEEQSGKSINHFNVFEELGNATIHKTHESGMTCTKADFRSAFDTAKRVAARNGADEPSLNDYVGPKVTASFIKNFVPVDLIALPRTEDVRNAEIKLLGRLAITANID